MPNITFYLDSRMNRNGEKKLFYSFTFRGSQVRKATGIALQPKFWSTTSAKVLQKHPQAALFNKKLLEIKTAAERIIAELQTNPKLATQYITETLNEVIRGKRYELTFYGYFEKYIETHTPLRAQGFQKLMKNTLHVFQTFERDTHYEITFDSINYQFYQQFRNYCIAQGKVNNTVSRYVKDLKAVLRWCKKQGVDIHPDVESFTAKWETPSDIALTVEELDTLEMLDLSHSSRLENVRDLFIIGCCTGLRWSDLSRLRAEHIQNGNIVIHTQKTRDDLVIPILSRVQRVLDKHPHFNFRSISAQKFNDYIKEVCREAGFTDIVIRTNHSGSRTVEEKGAKWEFVASHTMRRTFVTIAKQLELDDHVVMTITGHKSLSNFRKYNKQTQKQIHRKLKEKWNAADEQSHKNNS